jgi:hypothetical protein
MLGLVNYDTLVEPSEDLYLPPFYAQGTKAEGHRAKQSALMNRLHRDEKAIEDGRSDAAVNLSVRHGHRAKPV